MRYFSTFSGIGGFELGIGNKGECIGYSEIDKYAIKIYESHFPHKNYGDITKIDERGLPDFDLLCGGFPCQSFSIAGKRGGFEDTRGTLFFDIARIARAKKPLFMLLENVKGLISHDKGKTLETILATLQELGYYVNYEVHNSKDHGVPQNRERIFFLCTRINALVDDGLAKTTNSSERLIQEWLFQILLNNLEEAKKLQGHESKDWVLGYLICLEIARNQKLSGENTSDGITVPMAGSTSLFGVEAPWQNIATWLNKKSGADLSDTKSSTISTAISKITESKTFSFSQMFLAILLATVRLRESSKNSWNGVLSNLILLEEDIKYERINSTDEKVVVSESGSMHKSENLEAVSEHFSIGHLRGTPRPQVFPFTETTDSIIKIHSRGKHQQDFVYQTDGIMATLAAGNHASTPHLTKIYQMNNPTHSNNRVYADSGLEPSLNTMQGGNRQPKVTRAPLKFLDRNQKNIDGDYAFTVDSMNTGGVNVDSKIRRLTPLECERLQGFSDGWTEGISDSQRYKCLGNAVTVNVIRDIIQKMI